MPTLTEHLAGRRRRMVMLTSGLRVEYHLPDVRRCLIRAEGLDLHGMNDDAQRMHRAWWYGREVIGEALERVDGFDAPTDRQAVVELLDPADRAELLRRLDEELTAAEPADAAAVDLMPTNAEEAAARNRAAFQEALTR